MAYFSDLFSNSTNTQQNTKQSSFQSPSPKQGYFTDLNFASPTPKPVQTQTQTVKQPAPQKNFFQQAGDMIGNVFNGIKGALGGNLANDFKQNAPLEQKISDIPIFGGMLSNAARTGSDIGQIVGANLPNNQGQNIFQQKQQADAQAYNMNLKLIQAYNNTSNSSEKARLGSLIKQNMNSSFDLPKIIPVVSKTPVQVGADVTGVGIDTLLAGIGGGKAAESVGQSFLKTLLDKKVLSVAAGAGVLSGTQQALSAGETKPLDIAKSAATSALTFPAMQIGLEAGAKGLSTLANQVFQRFSKEAIQAAATAKNQTEMSSNLDNLVSTALEKSNNDPEVQAGIKEALQKELQSFTQKQPLEELKQDPQIGQYVGTLEKHIQDLGGTPEDLKKLTPFDTPEVIKAREEQAARPNTFDINTPERTQFREQLTNKLYQNGGYFNPEERPTTEIKSEKRADIVMGQPVAGKSTVLATPLVKEHGAILVDSDEAKLGIPESDNGKFAGVSHRESAHINNDLLNKALDNGNNVVIPVVGSNLDRLRAVKDALVEEGYQVHLHLNEVSPETAATRAVQRFQDTGRFVDPNYVYNEVGLKPSENYAMLKTEKGITSYEKYNNEVPKGQAPTLIERGTNAGVSGERPSDIHGDVNGSVSSEAARPQETSHSSVQLNAGIDPGIAKFLSEDVKPKVEDIAAAGKEAKQIVNPSTASEKAARAADVIRKANAQIANLSQIEAEKSKAYHSFFNKMSDRDNVTNISAYEKDGKFASAPKGYDELYRKSMDTSHTIMKSVYGDNKVGYIENYVRRQFKFGSAADETKGVAFLTNYSKSLSGSKSPLQHRVLNMPLDEALQNMKDRGIDVKMATTNPEVLRQWSLRNAQRSLAYADAWKQLKDNNLISFVKQGDRLPEDMIKLKDRAAEVFYPSDAGMVRAGSYYADANVARILNNAISSGLEGSATFKGLRTIENTLNQFQLGISGFHALGSSINAGISDFALGVRKLSQGDIGGVKNIGLSLTPFGLGSVAKDIYQGRSIIEGLKNNSPEAYKFMEEKLNPAGGRLGLDERYRITAYENMLNAFANKNFIGGVGRIPSAVVETVGKPLMEYAIPRVKLGAFADLAENVLSRLPADASKEVKQRVLSQAWASIDNRFGQLVYDNLFWNKVGKDVAMFSTRSVGWNLGTIREIGGALKDISPVGGKGLKKPQITDRVLYSASLPLYVGVIGAVYQYLHTGQMPSSAKDYFYPKNGLTDKNGNPDRVSLPSYMKDVFAYAKDPVGTLLHKTSPLIDVAYNLAHNRDYYNNFIRTESDPIGTQLAQTGTYLLKNILPFSLQQQQQLKSEGANPERQAESFVGIIPAPRSVVASDKQKKLQQVAQEQYGLPGPKTPEQQQITKLKNQARTDIQNGNLKNSDAFKQLVQQGVIKTRKQAEIFINDSKLTPNQRTFKHLSIQNKQKVLH